jgi:hypothetical protein
MHKLQPIVGGFRAIPANKPKILFNRCVAFAIRNRFAKKLRGHIYDWEVRDFKNSVITMRTTARLYQIEISDLFNKFDIRVSELAAQMFLETDLTLTKREVNKIYDLIRYEFCL